MEKRTFVAIFLALAITLALPAWNAPAAENEAPASASETDTYTQMLRRYNAVNAELTHALNEIENGVETSPYPKRVLSMRKNASVTIGGEFRATYAFSTGGGEDHTFGQPPAAPPNRGKFDAKSGSLSISTARISVDARVGDRWRGYIDMNLNGDNALRASNDKEPFLINQAYIELMKGAHSGFGGIFGLVKLPFGLWNRPNLFVKSFLDSPDLSNSFLAPGVPGDDLRLPHASRFIDPAVAAMIYYEMRDIIRFDAAVFQEREKEDLAFTGANGRRKIRSEEFPPYSWQTGLSLQPLEGWELTAHFRNRYSRAEDGAASGATDNEQALVVGVAAEIPGTKLAASVEYAHGWNQGFNKHVGSDSVSAGLSYTLTPRLTLLAQGEWLRVKDSGRLRNHRLYRAMLGAEYELAEFLTLETGWQYEYWKSRASAPGESRLSTANTLYFGTRFIF